MEQGTQHTYNLICFTDLAYEFDFSDKKEAEKKIKRCSKYYGLGAYNQERIEYIINLKRAKALNLNELNNNKHMVKPKGKCF